MIASTACPSSMTGLVGVGSILNLSDIVLLIGFCFGWVHLLELISNIRTRSYIQNKHNITLHYMIQETILTSGVNSTFEKESNLALVPVFFTADFGGGPFKPFKSLVIVNSSSA